jgi:16S rRNA (adenine1518-N6/adenine1519-N6)-dimethyltransferase
LGQHFLARLSILTRIAEAACGESSRNGATNGSAPVIIEIGPGKGALTKSLLGLASHVIAIELDSVLVHYLRQTFCEEIEAGKLELIEGDVLNVGLPPLQSKPVIAGNLPYYITSPILEWVFALRGSWERAVFLVQAEVAERVTAKPGTRDFGYLSVLAQVHSHTELLFHVPREAFRPPPKVESAVIRLTPRDAAVDFGITDIPGFLRFAQNCFRQKRKTLRNNLLPVYGPDRVEALPEAKMRAEQLGLTDLAAIYGKLSR